MSRSHANNGVDAQHANTDVRDVHRAALAAIASSGFAVKLGHHAMDFHSFGDAMPMAAVRGGDPIVGFERRAHADGAGLLAGVIVHRANRYTCFDEPLETLFEFPDQRQVFVYPEQFFARREGLCEARSAGGGTGMGTDLTLHFDLSADVLRAYHPLLPLAASEGQSLPFFSRPADCGSIPGFRLPSSRH